MLRAGLDWIAAMGPASMARAGWALPVICPAPRAPTTHKRTTTSAALALTALTVYVSCSSRKGVPATNEEAAVGMAVADCCRGEMGYRSTLNLRRNAAWLWGNREDHQPRGGKS